jgi:hypothetical protein
MRATYKKMGERIVCVRKKGESKRAKVRRAKGMREE